MDKNFIENRIKYFKNKLGWAIVDKAKAEKLVEEYSAAIVEWEEALKDLNSKS